MEFTFKPFKALSTHELYAILGLRQQVFMLEQQSLYKDIDGADLEAQHLLAYQAGEESTLCAYLRLLADKERVTIGRVIVTKDHRGQGLGTQLLNTALKSIAKEYPKHSIVLSAQFCAQTLYERLGFKVVSQPYDDAGVLHVDMLKVVV